MKKLLIIMILFCVRGNYHLHELRKREIIFKLKQKKLLPFGYPKLIH